MNFFATIHEQAAKRKLRYVVIGGLAVNRHGILRETADLDILISKDDRTPWLEVLTQLGYAKFTNGGPFIQFPAPRDNAWPVDLMLVPEQTFFPILNESVPAQFYDVEIKVPSLRHMIALKLHARKNSHPGRFLKDFLDVEYLIQFNRLDINSEEIRDLFRKYGTQELYEKLSRSIARG